MSSNPSKRPDPSDGSTVEAPKRVKNNIAKSSRKASAKTNASFDVKAKLKPKANAKPKPKAEPFRFLDLPREIRDMIIKLYLGSVGNWRLRRISKITYLNITRLSTGEPDLAFVSRQLRDESLDMFYRGNDFQLHVQNLNFDPVFKWLANIGLTRSHTIAGLTVHLIGRDSKDGWSNAQRYVEAKETLLSPGAKVSFRGNNYSQRIAWRHVVNMVTTHLREAGLAWDRIQKTLIDARKVMDWSDRVGGLWPDEHYRIDSDNDFSEDDAETIK